MSLQRRDCSAFLILAALAASCVGTDVGNPPDDERTTIATLSFSTYDEEAEGAETTRPAALHFSDGTEIESAWLAVESVSLVECDGETVHTVQGPFAVELTSATVHPRPVVFTDLRDDLCRVRVRLGVAKALPEGASPELVGRSVLVKGTTSAGVPYTIASVSPRTLSYEGEGLSLDEEHVRFVTTFVPTRWLEGIEARPNAPDSARVDLSVDPDAVSRFLGNLLQSSRVVKDENRDTRISPEEYARPIADPIP